MGDPVLERVAPADGVPDRMHDRDHRVLRSDARDQGADERRGARLEVGTVGDRPRQRLDEQPQRLQGVRVGQRLAVGGVERLDRPGEGRGAARRSQLGPGRRRELRIEHGDLRDQRVVAEEALDPLLGIAERPSTA